MKIIIEINNQDNDNIRETEIILGRNRDDVRKIVYYLINNGIRISVQKFV